MRTSQMFYRTTQVIGILILAFITIIGLTSCVRNQARVIIITATFPPELPNSGVVVATQPIQVQPTLPPAPTIVLSEAPQQPLTNPTPNPTQDRPEIPSQHTVQSGETLSIIAQRYNLSMESVLEANDILNPNILSVGQVLNLPGISSLDTPSFKIIPDSRLVRAPGSRTFDVVEFVIRQPGYIRIATDEVTIRAEDGSISTVTMSGAQIVERVSTLYSVDPKVLLALLEFRAGWLSNQQPRPDLLTHPLISVANSGGINRSGLLRQLLWAANELNRGYYGWKYRGVSAIQFPEGLRTTYSEELNPGSIAIQYFLSLGAQSHARWMQEVDLGGFYTTYFRYFGDPFQDAIEPLVPSSVSQPNLILPFESGVEWRLTGGPHGGWDTGSAWASLDFAPSSDRPAENIFCYVADEWVVAAAPGVIARNREGAVVLDLDADGDESTGWTINYLHLSSTDSIPEGTRVATGDRLGRPSCAGGFSDATHLHISRRFNGEWIPADCQACSTQYAVPRFVMGEWQSIGLVGQEYQGYLENGELVVYAEQGRETTINRISG